MISLLGRGGTVREGERKACRTESSTPPDIMSGGHALCGSEAMFGLGTEQYPLHRSVNVHGVRTLLDCLSEVRPRPRWRRVATGPRAFDRSVRGQCAGWLWRRSWPAMTDMSGPGVRSNLEGVQVCSSAMRSASFDEQVVT